MMTGCGLSQETSGYEEDMTMQTVGDSTIYGLACDGCNDTIVVYLRLPYTDSNPDTLNVLEAVKQHRLMGTPRIGDKLAIIRNGQDSTKADLVIVMEQLLGQWRYLQYPTLHQRADMEGHTLEQKISQLDDSLKILLDTPCEYGIDIKNDNMMFVLGSRQQAMTSDEESLIEYPTVAFYNEWHLFNGRFVMLFSTTDSTDVMQTTLTDTAAIELLETDSLVLQFKDGQRCYYRKVEEPKE